MILFSLSSYKCWYKMKPSLSKKPDCVRKGAQPTDPELPFNRRKTFGRSLRTGDRKISHADEAST